MEFFEEQLRRTQHEVATYGRRADEGLLSADEIYRLQSEARIVLARATVVAELGGDQLDRVRAELEALISAVRPILDSDQALISAHSA